MSSKQGQISGAMGFYHRDGLPAAWHDASKFAGDSGRIATLPDIVEARLATKPGDYPWEIYFTTLTAEYLGFSRRQGRLILIVAHGIGPMATLDGVMKAYSWEYKDKERNRRGGRITQQEFWDLEDGKYGEVSIIDLDDYCKRYRYPFMEVLRVGEARLDPVLRARLGPLGQKYLDVHSTHAKAWHREQLQVMPENKYGTSQERHKQYLDRRQMQHLHDSETNPFILQVEGAANRPYRYGRPDLDRKVIEPGYALAHLISIGGLCHLHHQEGESLVNNISCHEWSNGVRFVGIRAGMHTRDGLQSGPDAHELLRQHWQDLLIPIFPPDIVAGIGFAALMSLGKQWFTQYPKTGESMDSWEPEYRVTLMEKIGEPVLFRTTGVGPFFRFGINEVRAIAPPGANAYFFVSETEVEQKEGKTYHVRMVQFYRCQADTTKRLMRTEKLARDYDRMMALMTKERNKS